MDMIINKKIDSYYIAVINRGKTKKNSKPCMHCPIRVGFLATYQPELPTPDCFPAENHSQIIELFTNHTSISQDATVLTSDVITCSKPWFQQAFDHSLIICVLTLILPQLMKLLPPGKHCYIDIMGAKIFVFIFWVKENGKEKSLQKGYDKEMVEGGMEYMLSY